MGNTEPNPADPYMTLLGYFNSLRELGGARRLIEDEVRNRLAAYATRKRIGETEGLFENRQIGYEPVELTSRISTALVSEAKRRLASIRNGLVMPASKQTLSFCNRCQSSTRHSELIAHPHESRDRDGPFPRIVNATWNLLECLGCGSRRVIEQCADFKNPRETHYPPVQSRMAPAWEQQLTNELRQLIRETYCALNSDCPCLAVMGTRALIDMVLTDLVGDCGNFTQKLGNAVAKGFLTDGQRGTIEVAVELGHAASHRAFVPSKQQVMDGVEIVEHILKDQYFLGPISSRLRSGVPPRPKGSP